MNELTPISQYLCNAVDSIADSVDLIAENIEPACQLITQSLLQDGKLIVCGNGFAAPIATLFTTCMMHQLEFERPSLPALNISIDSTSISAIAKDGNYHNVYAKQLRALAQAGDTLIAISIDGNCSNIVQAIQTAHEKQLNVVALSGMSQGKISAVIQNQDVEINLDADSSSGAIERLLFTINAICHHVEAQLFGGMCSR